MLKRAQKITLLILLAVVSGSVYAGGACTYREAIMALERGNAVRGMALMRMAYRDGDDRASQYLAKNDLPVENPVENPAVASIQQGKALISLNQAISE